MNYVEICRAHDDDSGMPCPSCGYVCVQLPEWIKPVWYPKTGWFHPLFTVGSTPAIWMVESHGLGNKLSRRPPKGFDTQSHREHHVTASTDGPNRKVIMHFPAEDLLNARPI